MTSVVMRQVLRQDETGDGFYVGTQSSQMGVTNVVMRRWVLCWSTEQSNGNGKCGDEEMVFIVGPQSSQMGVTSVVVRRWALCWSTEQSDGSGKCGDEEVGFMLVHRAVRWEWRAWSDGD